MVFWVDATGLPSLYFYQPPTPNDAPIQFSNGFQTLDVGSSRINHFDATLVANYVVHYFPVWIEFYQPRLRVIDRCADVFWERMEM